MIVLAKSIYCDRCAGEIKYKEDLVTATSLFQVAPYHEECYAKDLKGVNTLFVNNQPINGLSGNFIAITSFIFALILLFIAEGVEKWASIVLLIPIAYRLFSYLYYERHL